MLCVYELLSKPLTNFALLINNIDYECYYNAYISNKNEAYISIKDLGRLYIYVIDNINDNGSKIIRRYYIPIVLTDGTKVDYIDYLSTNIIKIHYNNNKFISYWKLTQTEEDINNNIIFSENKKC